MIVCLFSLALLCGASIASVPSDGWVPPPTEDDQSQLLTKLREDVKILKESYREVLADVADKHRDEIKKHEIEIQWLKDTVNRLEEQLNALRQDQKKPIGPQRLEPSAVIARSCEELSLSDQSLETGMYWIDPDGHGTGDAPIHVFCNMTTGSTSILHDSESPTDVGQCWDAGCYSRQVKYNATMRQMIALMELSAVCTQSITYDCKMAPMEFNGSPQSWWTDRNGVRRHDFTGGNSTTSKCQCALDDSCLDRELQCNCNALSPVQTSDNGMIMDKSSLPVTRLNFGRILTQPASGRFTLSRLECYGRELMFDSTRPPTSCQDLWRIGHTISGYYSVQQSNVIETVYCDMTQVPGQGKTVPAFVSPKQYDKLARQLEAAAESLQNQADEVIAIKSSIGKINTAISSQKRTILSQNRKFESKDAKLARDLVGLSKNQQKQRAAIAEMGKKPDRPRATSIDRMPETCADLYAIGHSLSGIYPIKGDNYIEMVYCDMTSAVPGETRIGMADVKSSPVHFYVQRRSPFYLEGKGRFSATLPFEITRSNQGSGMDARTGVFTAPKPGTYVFNFGAIKQDKAQHVDIFLRLNDVERVASVYGSEHKGYFTLSLQSILNLKKNDRVYLIIQSASGGGIYDDDDMTTHFTGFLLDEQLF